MANYSRTICRGSLSSPSLANSNAAERRQASIAPFGKFDLRHEQGFSQRQFSISSFSISSIVRINPHVNELREYSNAQPC